MSASLALPSPRLRSGGSDPQPEIERMVARFDTHYCWNYGSGKAGLRELYEKAKREQCQVVLASPAGQLFRSMIFARVVPNLKRLQLLTPRVREAFDRLGILQFEHLDPEQQDRELGFA